MKMYQPIPDWLTHSPEARAAHINTLAELSGVLQPGYLHHVIKLMHTYGVATYWVERRADRLSPDLCWTHGKDDKQSLPLPDMRFDDPDEVDRFMKLLEIRLKLSC